MAGKGLELTKDGYLRPAMVRRTLGLENRDALWDYMVKTIGAPKHQAVKLMTRLPAHWRVQGFAPAYSVRDQVIISALEASGFATRSGDPIPEEWVWEIDRTVRQSLDCLQLTIPGRRFLLAEQDLSDGGLKFLLQVQALLGDR
ncbi:hypothetical protein [Arthrobacter oryzae]|uniref:hypothetical protein n=1 Tax=Arthrobacter oryzae TaxID=409290 RepID=UPI00273C6F3A|nr:hypothetical protein [Arthrobacter oryzae]WLQ05102.1 hypothetical protein Q8Z05_13185 [Arthrobacter oryzae]